MGQTSSKGSGKFKIKKLSPEDKQKLVRRKEILREIVESERRYVDTLSICVKYFLLPLRENNLVKEEDIKQIFSILETIAFLHQDLFTVLQERVQKEENDDYLIISDIFIERSSFLKMYTTYINNYDVAIRTLIALQDRSDDLEDFLKKQTREPETRQLSLESYLIAPVQRLPRYVLLFTELVNNTPQKHDDYLPLVETLEQLKSIVHFVNEERRQSESTKKMMELSSLFQSKLSIVEPHRKFIVECDCSVKSILKTRLPTAPTEPSTPFTPELKPFSGSDQDSKIFLFNDSVLLGRPVSMGLFDSTIKFAIRSFGKMDEIDITDVADTEDTKNTFTIAFLNDLEEEPPKSSTFFDWILGSYPTETTNEPYVKTYTITTNTKPTFLKEIKEAQNRLLEAKRAARSPTIMKTKKVRRNTLIALFTSNNNNVNNNNRTSTLRKAKEEKDKEKEQQKPKEEAKEKTEKEIEVDKEKERQEKEKKEKQEKEKLEKEAKEAKETLEKEQREKEKQKEKEQQEKEKAEKEREIEKQKEKERKEKEKAQKVKDKEKEKKGKEKKKKKKDETSILNRVSNYFDQ